MKANSNLPPIGAPAALTPVVKRKLVQDAVSRFLAGQLSDGDLAIFRDHNMMKTATADQACQFLESATGRNVPFDVYVKWANLLRQRYLQSLSSGRRNGSLLSQETVQVPAALPAVFEQEDENTRD